MNDTIYDIAVVGSGFAGSLFAMICQRLGRSVILLEKGKHPRFAIGESSTPITNLLIEELSARYDLPSLTPLAKWGTWQESYPHIACGLKRGFSFYHHTLGEAEADDLEHQKQLLVAASPNDRISDTHWYRPDFDHFFVQEAQKMGVAYRDEIDLQSFCETEDEVRLPVRARFVVDATGPRGFLHRVLRLQEIPLPDYPQTQALYSHFRGVGLYGDPAETPPYPVDAAAVHHVFDGGWIWVLQFNNGVSSAGVAATTEAAERLGLSAGAEAWARLLGMIPRLQQQFENAEAIRPFTYVPQLSFRSGVTAGKRWVQLPSAAGFVDPLMSTGFATTLLGISRLAEVIQKDWHSPDFSCRIQEVALQNEQDLLAAGRLIAGFYASMNRFPVFVATLFLYFTAVIYTETVRRLEKPELAPGFLLHAHEYFGPMCAELLERVADADSKRFCEDIIRAIEPWNLAGLGDAARRNWYPVKAADLLAGAWKVGATPEQIRALLVKLVDEQF